MEGEIKEGQFWPTFKYLEDFLKMKKKFNPFAASAKSLIQNEHSKRSGLRDFDDLKTKISPYSNLIHEFIFISWKNAKLNEISFVLGID